jgi:hypothetical protein
VAPVFHDVFNAQYDKNFKAAIHRALEVLGEEKTVNIYDFFHELTYESASLGLFGANIQAKVPFAGGKEAEATFQ